MTKLLIKLFIKDNEQLKEQRVRMAYGTLSGIVGIFMNVFLFIVKLLISVFVNSISIMADAFNNLSDAASSVVSLIG